MRKFLYLIGIVAALGILGYLTFILFFRQGPPQGAANRQILVQSGLLPSTPLAANESSSPSDNNYSITDQFPKTPTIKIGTSQGTVEVKNFYLTLVDTEEGSVILKRNDGEYEIAYRRDDSLFRVELWSPSAAVRQNAEKDLLQILGVGQSDACKLNVEVTLFRTVQDGTSSPLSFCFK